jgi:hypothetical protein
LERPKSYHGVIEQSKTINSPDSDIGLLNNHVHINQEDDRKKKRQIKTVKNEQIYQGKLANKTNIPDFLTVTPSPTQSPPTPNTSPSKDNQSMTPLLMENKKNSKYFGRKMGRKASRPTRRVGNRVYKYKF